MKFTRIIEYREENKLISVKFYPIQNVPGFSHRVIILVNNKQIANDWLGDDFNVTAKNAGYYTQKHSEEIHKALEALKSNLA